VVGARASLACLRACVCVYCLVCLVTAAGLPLGAARGRVRRVRLDEARPLLAPAPLAPTAVAALHAAFAAAVGGDGDDADDTSTRPYRHQPVARLSASAPCPPPLPPSRPSASTSGSSSCEMAYLEEEQHPNSEAKY